jgi:secreted trypsin-like serine protease
LWRKNSKPRQPPSQEAVREAHDRLSKSLTIKVSDVTSAPADGQALAILRSMQQARAIINSDSSTDAEKGAAKIIEDQRTRQLEAKASAPETLRVVGDSKPAPEGGFQYQVAVIFSGADPLDGLHCGGTLVDSSWVLTAAHCFSAQTQNGDFQIFTGSRKLSDSVHGRVVPIAKIVRNKYDPTTNERDIALIKLATPITDQQPMDLADSVIEAAKITRMSTVSGWGVTVEGASIPSDDLRFAFVPLVDHNMCRKTYQNNSAKDNNSAKKIEDDMICAGEGKADACQGDSGGPLVIKTKGNKPYLDGIVSWGRGCNKVVNGTVFPGVYVSVPYYFSWIRSTMQAQ